MNGLQWSYCNVGIGIVFQGQHCSVFFLFKTKKEKMMTVRSVRHDLWSTGNKLKTTMQSSLQRSTSPSTRIFHLSVMHTDLGCININIQDIKKTLCEVKRIRCLTTFVADPEENTNKKKAAAYHIKYDLSCEQNMSSHILREVKRQRHLCFV